MSLQSTIAYLDCFAGISGDMFLGALLHAGLPLEVLREQLATLGLAGIDVGQEPVTRGGIAAIRLKVTAPDHQHHRSLADIEKIITMSGLDATVRHKAMAIFTALAEAEATVHGCGLEQVHFHEVGALDAILDVVGAAIGLVHLGIDTVVCAPLPMPRGSVQCAHGRLPLPAPAVCELVRGLPVYGVEANEEMVTPTGAAIVRALATDFGPMPAMTVSHTGYGAGSRELSGGQPNLLRLVVGQWLRVEEAQEVEVIETHIDDASPELLAHVAERLAALGALDVSITPMLMKKGRPGFLLRVVSSPAKSLAIKECILSESSAIGVRFRREQRMTLSRQHGTVPTPWGRVRVKLVHAPTGPVLTPEHDDCARLAAEAGVPLRQIHAAVQGCPLADFMEE
ncbi:MAG: nickel pincer cofactor biosynthesis protein LarC [Thermodesulfobacteriota bacterium]